MMPLGGAAEGVLASVVARLRSAGCVFAEEEADLLLSSADTPQQLAELVDRRCSGVPLEHVLGWAMFRGRRIAVDPGVFVPRRRTEYLVELAVSLSRPGQVVVDLCCGSGAIGTALAAEVPGIEVHAVEIDPVAARCAQRNLDAFGGRAYAGDLYAPLPDALRGRVDLLLVNAPYVPTGHVPLLPPEARLYEPRVAYDGGDDGLDVQRRVSAHAAQWLAAGGYLLVETSTAQAPTTVAIVSGDGLSAEVATCEDLSATVVIGSRS
jgi:release factor glutamine methyltransferase